MKDKNTEFAIDYIKYRCLNRRTLKKKKVKQQETSHFQFSM